MSTQTNSPAGPPPEATKPAASGGLLFPHFGSKDQQRHIEFRLKHVERAENPTPKELGAFRSTNKTAAGVRTPLQWLFPSISAPQHFPQPLWSWTDAEGLPWDPSTWPVHDPTAGMNEQQKRDFHIQMLRNEIKEKQHRAELLMRLFVNDEKDYWIGIPRWKKNGGEARVIYEAVEMRTNAKQLKALQRNLHALENEETEATMAGLAKSR